MKLNKILTTHVYPPIPDRDWDWCATYDDDEPNDDGWMAAGHGPTETDAVVDLVTEHPRGSWVIVGRMAS